MTANWRENTLHLVEIGRCLNQIEGTLRVCHAKDYRDHNDAANQLGEAVAMSRRLTRALESVRDTAELDRQQLNAEREARLKRAEPK